MFCGKCYFILPVTSFCIGCTYCWFPLFNCVLYQLQVRVNTRLLYQQTKFNLLWEESEGYAKLVGFDLVFIFSSWCFYFYFLFCSLWWPYCKNDSSLRSQLCFNSCNCLMTNISLHACIYFSFWTSFNKLYMDHLACTSYD